MVRRVHAVIVAAAFGAALSACGAGWHSGSSLPEGDGVQTVGDAAAADAHRPTGSHYAVAAIDAVNALGSQLAALEDNAAAMGAGLAMERSDGACTDGQEFFSPARGGDAGSTETLEFFDASCTRPARATLRTYERSGPSGEIVRRTISSFARGESGRYASRTETTQLSRGIFGSFGFAANDAGFERTTASRESVAGRPALVSVSSALVLPPIGGTGRFCHSTAGYHLSGLASLDRTFGWQNETTAGAFRLGGDRRTVTWSATQRGASFAAPAGSLSFVAKSGMRCPVRAPTFALSSSTGSNETIALQATYRGLRLWNLSVRHAVIAGGYVLDVSTQRGRGALPNVRIVGLLGDGKTRVATLHADAFGTGVLSITSTGAQYAIAGWKIVR
jgi:hypothetical protein